MRTITYAESMEMLVMLRDFTSKPSGDEQVPFLKFCLANAWRSKSQYLQDMWVAYELNSRRNGFFIEFGGADGIKGSNSYMLETEFDWRGIVAEPARVWHPTIRNNRNCFIDNRCVWVESGKRITFNQPAIAAHSTIDTFSDSDNHADTRKDGLRYEVETVSLTDLLDHWRAPLRIDYLSIDTEGSELDILKAFDFDKYEIRLITIEHNHTEKRDEIYRFLASKGYVRKFEKLSNVDDWYVKSYPKP